MNQCGSCVSYGSAASSSAIPSWMVGSYQFLLCFVKHSAAMFSWWHLGFYKICETCFWQVVPMKPTVEGTWTGSHKLTPAPAVFWVVCEGTSRLWCGRVTENNISCFLGKVLGNLLRPWGESGFAQHSWCDSKKPSGVENCNALSKQTPLDETSGWLNMYRRSLIARNSDKYIEVLGFFSVLPHSGLSPVKKV